MPSKLELEMSRRESEKASAAASRRAEEAKAKKEQRERRLFERKEFDRLFSRLKKMVEGRWDSYGWGWTFEYKGKEYWISYDSWFSPKMPGDADGYDMSGHHWVLKSHFNASDGDRDGGAYSLGDGEGKTGLTEEVLKGLKELTKRGGG